MPENVTTIYMVLNVKVDLECHRCYKKVKKVLSKFPEVQDQIYEEKQNFVLIKVVSCCPEKIMQKICCKGSRTIQSIEIVVPKKKKVTFNLPGENPKEPEKKKKVTFNLPDEKPKELDQKKKVTFDLPEKGVSVTTNEPKKAKEHEKKKEPEPEKMKVPPIPIPGYLYPIGAGFGSCSHGYGEEPCFHDHGVVPSPCYGRPVYDSYGGGYRGYYVSQSDYFSEENASGCIIM